MAADGHRHGRQFRFGAGIVVDVQKDDAVGVYFGAGDMLFQDGYRLRISFLVLEEFLQLLLLLPYHGGVRFRKLLQGVVEAFCGRGSVDF